MAGTLGYLPIEGDWGTTEPPADLRVAEASPRPGNPPSAGPKHSGRLGERLRAGLAPDGSGSGPAGPSNDTFVAVATARDAAAEYWLVDLGAGTVTFASREAQENSDWDVIGPAETWEQVMDGRFNYYVALRSCQLRYCDNDDEAGPLVPEARTGTLARLLGLAAW
jgi:hypothetical protein